MSLSNLLLLKMVRGGEQSSPLISKPIAVGFEIPLLQEENMSIEMPYPHIIVMGNPSDGFRFIGPFDDIEDARQYLETEASKENCWIAMLDVPAGSEPT